MASGNWYRSRSGFDFVSIRSTPIGAILFRVRQREREGSVEIKAPLSPIAPAIRHFKSGEAIAH